MRRIWNVLRGLALAVLTLGALLSLAFALIGLYDERRCAGQNIIVDSTVESFRFERTVWHETRTGRRIRLWADRDGLNVWFRGPMRADVSMVEGTWAIEEQKLIPGVAYYGGPNFNQLIVGGLCVSYWYFFVLFGFWPLLAVIRRIILRRRRAGTCRGCGYNLTGNVSGVCPECGQLAAAYNRSS